MCTVGSYAYLQFRVGHAVSRGNACSALMDRPASKGPASHLAPLAVYWKGLPANGLPRLAVSESGCASTISLATG
ncbi:unnamed protein product [Protopolystoma xenopodis]|uniref:Uncharacterized protein n=1 Tax=Protopolystoma xenopodis TaxID=117903 RepID=A0A3S5FBW5_9PLAT|nr:unnamed protein product [Protopolystoma xenopodis]